MRDSVQLFHVFRRLTIAVSGMFRLMKSPIDTQETGSPQCSRTARWHIPRWHEQPDCWVMITASAILIAITVALFIATLFALTKSPAAY